MSDNSYELDENYVYNFNKHLQNLSKNSECIIEDLEILEKLLEDIKIYNSKGYDVNNILKSVNTHNRDLKLCLDIVYNIKTLDNTFNKNTENLKKQLIF